MKLVNYEDVIDIVFDNYNEDLEDILDLLSALPKTEIVRCKDCKEYKYCFLLPNDDDYCSKGERREE